MEFHCHTAVHTPNLPALEELVVELDPAAVLDFDAAARALRVSTTLGERELLACLLRAGVPVSLRDIQRLPSVCCGGCSG